MPISYHHTKELSRKKNKQGPTRATLTAVIQIVSPGQNEEYPMNLLVPGLVRFVGERGRAYTPNAVIKDVHGREKGDFIGQLIGKWGSGQWHLQFPALPPGEYYFFFWLESGQNLTEVHAVRFYVTEVIDTKGGGV